jgi:hypothetical protein
MSQLTTTTDVREWARTQPDLAGQVPERGPLPKSMRDAYHAAHPVPGEVLGDGEADYDGGVTEADFPPEPEPAATQAGERKPARVRGTTRKGSGLRERLWGGQPKAKAGPKAKKRPRISLTSFVEDAWSDLAWLAAPLPPLQRVLYAQAPYAGVVLEDSVKGTVVDTVLQPVARAETAIRAVNGLAGPPVFVLGILTRGARVQVTGPDGQPLTDDEGQPVTDYDTPTKLMFMGLRYCLLQMTKVTAAQLSAVQERAEDRLERGRAVDEMIAWIFGMPAPPDVAAGEEEAIRRAQQMMGAPPNRSTV